MNKKIFVFLLAVTFGVSGVLHAQDDSEEKSCECGFGVKAGLNAYGLGGESNLTSTKLAYHGGGYADIKLNESFSLKPEVLYSVQGVGMKEDSLSEYTLTYINVPVQLKFKLVDGFSFVTGPQFGLLIGKNIPKEEEDLLFGGDGVESQDISVVYGFEYEFDFGLNAGVRYQLGLSPVKKREEDIEKSKQGFVNRGLQFSVGYSF